MLETRWGTCLILLAKADHSGCWDSESVDGWIVGGDALPKFLFRRCSVSGMNSGRMKVTEKIIISASTNTVQECPFSINGALMAGPKKPEITSAA